MNLVSVIKKAIVLSMMLFVLAQFVLPSLPHVHSENLESSISSVSAHDASEPDQGRTVGHSCAQRCSNSGHCSVGSFAILADRQLRVISVSGDVSELHFMRKFSAPQSPHLSSLRRPPKA